MKKTLLFISIITLLTSSLQAKGKTCKNFKNQSEAQAYFNAHKQGWKRLDGDKDGEACECLQGGSGYNKYTCKRWRKKYGK